MPTASSHRDTALILESWHYGHRICFWGIRQHIWLGCDSSPGNYGTDSSASVSKLTTTSSLLNILLHLCWYDIFYCLCMPEKVPQGLATCIYTKQEKKRKKIISRNINQSKWQDKKGKIFRSFKFHKTQIFSKNKTILYWIKIFLW